MFPLRYRQAAIFVFMSFETDKWTWILFTTVVASYSTKQEFLKMLQISQENTWAKFSFLGVSKIVNGNHFFLLSEDLQSSQMKVAVGRFFI